MEYRTTDLPWRIAVCVLPGKILGSTWELVKWANRKQVRTSKEILLLIGLVIIMIILGYM